MAYLHVAGARCVIGGEEDYGPAELEVMLYVGVSGAEDLHGKLVQRVIVAPGDAQWEPCVAPLDDASEAHLVCLTAERLLVGLIFEFEQMPLLLQCQYG